MPLNWQKKLGILCVLICLTLVSCDKVKGVVYYKAASRAHTKGDLKSAIELYKKSIEADPTKADVQYNLGVAYLDHHDYDKADQQIQKLKEMGESETAALLQKLWHEEKDQ